MNLTPEQLHILQHSLGRDKYGQADKTYSGPDYPLGSYRNRYICDPNDDVTALVAAGYMKDHGPQGDMSGMHFYAVTEAGFRAMICASPQAPKLTRGQRMYRDFLSFDGSMKFGEYLKWRHANRKEIAAGKF